MSPTLEDILQEHFGMSQLELELIICARNFYLRRDVTPIAWKLEFNCLERVFVSINKDMNHRCNLKVSKINPGLTTVSGTEIFYYPLLRSYFRSVFCRMAQCTLEL